MNRARVLVAFRGAGVVMRLLLVSGAMVTAGCSARKTISGQAIPGTEKAYADGPDGLRDLWSDILTAAEHDQRGTVHDLLASMFMSDEDLRALFGEERAKELKPRYEPMMSRLCNIGGLELVARVAERKYDDVEVFAVEASQGPEQRASLEALREKHPIYAVRVKKKDDKLGLRYDFFVFREGRWITGNQVARYLLSPVSADGGTPAVPKAPPRPAGPDSGRLAPSTTPRP